MRNRFVGLIYLTASLLAAAAASPCLAMPTEPSGTWVYAYIDELRLSADSLSLFMASLPYERCELGSALSHASLREGPGRSRMEYLSHLLSMELAPEAAWKHEHSNLFVGEVKSGLEGRSHARAGIDNLLRLSFYFREGVALWTYLRLTVTDPEAHRTETRPWGDYFRAGFDHGGVGYKGGRFSLFLGRDEVAWGARRDLGLLFSGTAPTMDMFRFTYLEDRVLFTSFHSKLRRGEGDPWDEKVQRYVSAHRLDFKLWPDFTFAVSEAVLYGGECRGFEPMYLNPIGVFYAEQWNSESEDNVLFSGDFTLLFPGAAEVRGEVVIDDFQYDFANPHEIGFGIDVEARNPLLDLYSLFGCSYFHVRNGTYGHKVEYNRYTHEGEVIGYPYGPDGDFLELRFAFSLPAEALWTVRFSQRRQGGGRVSDPQDGPPEDRAFPSGVVEKTLSAGFDVSWRPAYCCLLKGGLEWHGISNEANMKGADEDGLRVALAIAFNFKYDYERE
jgi:hypothetical protein